MIDCAEWGGCGQFVWSVYGLGFVTFAVLAIWPFMALRKTLTRLRRQTEFEQEAGTLNQEPNDA